MMEGWEVITGDEDGGVERILVRRGEQDRRGNGRQREKGDGKEEETSFDLNSEGRLAEK